MEESLHAFLAQLSVLPSALCRVRDALVKLGYDDVDDFAKYDDAALQRLRDKLATEGIRCYPQVRPPRGLVLPQVCRTCGRSPLCVASGAPHPPPCRGYCTYHTKRALKRYVWLK